LKGSAMASPDLKQRIYRTLRTAYFRDENDLIDVSDGPEDSVHLVVVSRKFDGQRLNAKSDLIWDLLMKLLPKDDWGKVTLSVGASPDDYKYF